MLRLILLAALAASLPLEPPSVGRHSGRRVPELKFRHDGTFQITVFSDFHLGESTGPNEPPFCLCTGRVELELTDGIVSAVPGGPARDLQTLQVMREVLDHEKPDFVVLNGDLITGEAASRRNNTRYIDQLVKPLVERKLSWGSTYGEHDHTFTLHGDSILRRERRFAGSRTRKMVMDKHAGTSNYFVPVFGAECVDAKHSKCHPELLLWFFDSRGGHYHRKSTQWGNPAAQPNWVDVSVVKWFRETNRQLSKAANRSIPALAFVHMPIKATASLQQDGLDLSRTPGINDDVPVSYQGRRWCDAKTYDLGALNCVKGGFDEPFMTALAAAPRLMGLFYGHDHGNTWCRRWQSASQVPGTESVGTGLNLCYGQHTGYGGYGHWIRGGRQIMVNRQRDGLAVQTHIRLEDGRIVGAVHLNSTFDEDSYPTTPDDETWSRLRRGTLV
ncbi:hypothetical protein E4U54_000841 [Claviceps lovelessii]|nr:hypothetical protein E4U54_000841 [Claviceps lovelessii]